MPKLTDDQVKHVAKLAKLVLTDDEVTKFQDQLSEIISFVEDLEKVDTSGIDPTSQTTGLQNVFKKDAIQTDRLLPLDQVLLNTKNSLNGYFVVDAVIDKDNE